MDVSHFDPSEISVKTTDNNIVVHGKFVYLALGVVEISSHYWLILIISSFYVRFSQA